jgi:hypothetical protein
MLRTTKRRKRRRRRAPLRVNWCPGLKGKLLGVCLNIQHRWRGSDVAGFHLVRITRAKVDRKQGELVLIVARLNVGREDTN